MISKCNGYIDFLNFRESINHQAFILFHLSFFYLSIIIDGIIFA